MEIYVKKRKLASGAISFSLVQRTNRGTPEEITKVLSNEVIDSVNSLLTSKTIPLDKAEALVKSEKNRLVAQLRPREIPLDSVNHDILERYWAKKYADRHLEDKESAYNRLYRSIKALGKHPLPTITEKQIQKAIAENITSRSTQRDAIAVIRRLLSFIGRTDLDLSKPRKHQIDISYISIADFALAVNKLDHLEKLVCWVAIATGARQGEVFGMRTFNEAYQAVHIQSQLSRKKKIKGTKNSRPRWAPVLSEGLVYVKEWLAVPEEVRSELRGKRWAELIGEATKGQVTFHDLRHSYAIALLQKGATMEQTARALGDSIGVCQEYYAGYTLTLTELEGFKKIL